MNVETLKSNIEKNNLGECKLLILNYKKNAFIPVQYFNAIAKKLNKRIQYIEPSSVLTKFDIFSSSVTNNDDLRVCFTTSFNSTSKLAEEENLIVVTKGLDKKFPPELLPYVVDIPDLESWQIKDYVYSVAEGVDQAKLDMMLDVCKDDIYRIENELNKLRIFQPGERKYVFDDFVSEGMFSDLSGYTIFNITDAVVKRDKRTLSKIYREIKNIDVEPIGLLKVLQMNFRNIISVQLTPNPTPEKCNLPANKFWATKYSCGFYTKDELLRIYSFLTDIDRRIKQGQFPMEILVDYLLVHII